MLLRETGSVYEPVYSTYALIDPRTMLVYYVGRTQDFHQRIQAHLENKDQYNQGKYFQTLEIIEAGFQPLVKLLSTTFLLEKSEVDEIFWINYYLGQGMPLTNIVDNPNRKAFQQAQSELRTLIERVENGQKSEKKSSYTPLPRRPLPTLPQRISPPQEKKTESYESREHLLSPELQAHAIQLFKSGIAYSQILRTLHKSARYQKHLRKILIEEGLLTEEDASPVNPTGNLPAEILQLFSALEEAG